MANTNNIKDFIVITLNRADLRTRGFITDNIDDITMQMIASKMGDFYLDDDFWVDLDMAARYFDVPHRDDDE